MKVIRSFKTGNKTIRYAYEGPAEANEQRTIDKFIGTAYNMSAYAIKQIEGRTSKAAEWIKVIYGESTDEGARKVDEAYKSIIQRIERGLRVRRENVFVNENGEDVPSVLSGADLGNGVVIIYDAFFKKTEGDEKGVNDRASVIMHEIAHLIGLKGDEEQKSYESAECLRNFTLLVCKIVKPEDLFIDDQEENEENETLQGEYGELPHNPNHHPAGSPQGGQFAPKEGADSGGGSESKDEKTSRTNSEKSESPKELSQIQSAENAGKSSSSARIRSAGHNKDPNRAYNSDGLTPDDFKQRFENGHPAVWGAIDIDVDGLKKEERNTVIVNVECEYSKYNEEGKLIRQKESVAVAYDVIADKNGNAKINRAGLINAITSQDKIEEGDIDISVAISTRPGSPGDNYPNNIEKVEWSEYQEPAPRPITDYASTHASTGAYPTSSTPRDKDGNISVTGGKIKNYTPSPEEKQVYSTKVKITVNQETAKKGRYKQQ